MKKTTLASMATLLSALAFTPAFGQPSEDVTVTEAWVRATVPQQKATGAFMHIRSTAGARIVDVKTTAAGIAQVHEMKMEGDVMHMRPMAALPLPAGKVVDLGPGGYHVMLMELKQQLKPGDTVPLTLVVEGTDGKRHDVDLKVPVRPLNSSAPSGGMPMK